MKIAVLTSSRADYGVYFPLLKLLKSNSDFEVSILAFGTHLADMYGKTVNQIKSDGFCVDYEIDTIPSSDGPSDISESIAKTINEFNKIWNTQQFDLIIALGDRYEMFAAVTSSVPYNIPVAHLHGGETTLGAIDNVFRHSITLMSKYHFTAAEDYKTRVIELIGQEKNVFNVGALSIDSLKQMKFLSILEFKEKYNIDLSKPTILITFHPETINFDKNRKYITELTEALLELRNYQQVITMPNSDTMGLHIREAFLNYAKGKENVSCVESFGSQGYLSCMKHCNFMLGNTSSGFIEAAFFQKPVINLGNRQKGRIITPNIISIPIEKKEILNAVKKAERLKNVNCSEIYGDGNAAKGIFEIIKNI